MAIIEQSDFSLGQIDDIFDTDVSQAQYLQSLKLAENAYITGQRIPQRRGSFGLINEPTAYPSSSVSVKFKNLEFQSSDGDWYQVLLQQNVLNTDAYLIKWGIDATLGVQVPIERHLVGSLNGIVPRDIDMTATDEYVVLANNTLEPQKLEVKTPISSSTLAAIDFSVVPSLDFGDLDYSKYSFLPKCTAGGSPSGSPQVCPVGQVFGAIIDVTRPLAGDEKFTSDWIGGMIVGETGASVEQPIGYGLITGISDQSATVQRFTVTVLQAFGTENFSQEGQVWSVRKPAWGVTQGYPKLTAFHKGRLWFANIRRYPMFIAGSKSNTPNSFNVGNGEPPDAIAYILQNSEGGGIKNIFGGQNLHMFTGSSQLAVVGGIDVGIEPGNFSPKSVSQFTSSTAKPVQYRSEIYFTSSDGRALVEIQEVDQSVAAGIISITAQDLIKNPVKFSVYTIPDTQDQILTMLNDDRTLTVYSKSQLSGVSAFTPYFISLLENETVEGLGVVDNNLYLITNKLRLLFSSKRVDLDGWEALPMVAGVVDVSGYPNLQAGDILAVTYEETVEGQLNNNYLGEFTVIDDSGLKIKTGSGVTAAISRIGKNYTTHIQTLPLYSSQTGSFKLRKVSTAWLEFFRSYNFTFNKRRQGLNLPVKILPKGENPQSVTGVSQIGIARGSQNDFFLDVIQDSPYNLTIQTLAWSITESVIS